VLTQYKKKGDPCQTTFFAAVMTAENVYKLLNVLRNNLRIRQTLWAAIWGSRQVTAGSLIVAGQA
jgi:hypothetical protein